MSENAVKQRTLMDAIDTLSSRCLCAEDVATSSRTLVEKFERTYGQPKEVSKEAVSTAPTNTPNIIEIIDELSRRIDFALDRTLININKVKNYID